LKRKEKAKSSDSDSDGEADQKVAKKPVKKVKPNKDDDPMEDEEKEKAEEAKKAESKKKKPAPKNNKNKKNKKEGEEEEDKGEEDKDKVDEDKGEESNEGEEGEGKAKKKKPAPKKRGKSPGRPAKKSKSKGEDDEEGAEGKRKNQNETKKKKKKTKRSETEVIPTEIAYDSERRRVVKPNTVSLASSSFLYVAVSSHVENRDDIIKILNSKQNCQLLENRKDIYNPMTHLVISEEKKRTLNVLYAIAHGAWLVKPEWVLSAEGRSQLKAPDEYEHKDLFPGAVSSRKKHQKGAQPILKNDDKYYVHESTVPRYHLEKLLSLCGGDVVTDLDPSTVCITSRDKAKELLKNNSCTAKLVTEDWLLDSICQWKLLEYEDFTLE